MSRGIVWSLAVAASLLAAPAKAQTTTRFDVPFAFEVNGRAMPAGHYDLISRASPVAEFIGVDSKGGTLSYWRSNPSLVDDGLSRLKFLKVGNHYYLRSGAIPGRFVIWPVNEKRLTIQAKVKAEPVVIVARR